MNQKVETMNMNSVMYFKAVLLSWFVEMEDPKADRKQARLCDGEFNEKQLSELYEAEIQNKVAQRVKQNRRTTADKTEGIMGI